jgi:hypothetical protein
MAKCTHEELKAHNLSAKSAAGVASQKKRGVQIIPTTNAEGSTLSTTIHIHERDHNGDPTWECIDKSKEPYDMLWVCISKPNFDHIKFHEQLYQLTIMPYAIKARDQHDRQQAIDLREHQIFADEDAALDANEEAALDTASDATASSHHNDSESQNYTTSSSRHSRLRRRYNGSPSSEGTSSDQHIKSVNGCRTSCIHAKFAFRLSVQYRGRLWV